MDRFVFKNPVGNIKGALNKESLVDSFSAALTPVIYIGVPSLLGLSGWTALAVGGLTTWMIGAAFKIPGMRAGAIGAMATHIAYAKLSGQLATWGVPAWRLADTAPNTDLNKPADTLPGAAGIGRLGNLRNGALQPGSRMVQFPQLPQQSVVSRPVQAQVAGLRGYNGSNVNWNKTEKDVWAN